MLISGFLAGSILHASEEAVKKANAEYRMALADCNEDKAISFVAANYREVGVRGNKLDYAKVQQVAGMLKLAKKLSGPDPKLADMVEMNMLIREQGIMSAEQRQQIEAMENTDAGKKLKQQLSTKVASLILFLENHKKAMKAAWQKHRVISCEVKKIGPNWFIIFPVQFCRERPKRSLPAGRKTEISGIFTAALPNW